MPFKKGHSKTGGIKKGGKHKRTKLKQELGIEAIKNIDQFKLKLIENWNEFLDSDDKNVKLVATRDLSKFVFPSKKQIETSEKKRTIEDLIKEDEDELSDLTVGTNGIKENK